MARRSRNYVALLGLLLAACASDVAVRNPVPENPLVKPVDHDLGVYYSPQLRNYSCIVDKGYIAAEWTIELGAPSVEMFEKILRSKFRTVERLQGDPLTVAAGRKALVLELTSFDGCEASWPIIGTTRMSLAYRARFLRADGTLVADLTVRGSSGPADAGLGDEGVHLTSLTEAAMRRAAADFAVQTETSKKVGRWLEGTN